MAEKKDPPVTPSKDWSDDWFEKHGVTEDDDKSFLRSRALADEYVEEARKQRGPKPPEKKTKKLFGGRNGD